MSDNIFVGESKEAKKSRKWLLANLEESIVEVTFTKKDGTERVMNCTLQEDYLPETTGVGRAASFDAVSVYDVDKEDWRSFRWDSVKAVKLSVESTNA
jgi:WYL_2, Sm-like SH3 beta-barrel fold